MRMFPGIIAFIVVAALLFATGVVHAQDIPWTAQSTGKLMLTPDALDAFGDATRAAVRDELVKGVTVKVKPAGQEKLQRASP